LVFWGEPLGGGYLDILYDGDVPLPDNTRELIIALRDNGVSNLAEANQALRLLAAIVIDQELEDRAEDARDREIIRRLRRRIAGIK
jgi:hypothetical protein